MITPPFPQNESERLRILRQYQILDTSPERAFDDLTRLASDLCEGPIALITFIDDHRQWFKSRIGLSLTETPREISFCAHAILQRQPFIIPDASSDPRFADNPWVTSDPHVRFYAGAPLLTPQGYPLGTVCVMDHLPRTLQPRQIEGLQAIAHETMLLLDLRRNVSELSRAVNTLRSAEDERARLLSLEQEARAAAVRAQWRFTFLAEASEILSESLDYNTTLASVARLAIPFLADGCVVDLLEEDRSIRRVAVAAADPAKEALGWELIRRYPPEPGGEHPLQRVLATGRAMFLSDIPDTLLEAVARDPEHLKIAKSLGIRSAMVVPLSARGKTWGALSFVTMESGRRFGEDDLSLAEDLARRIAVAVDNARLYRAAQEEIQERKEAEEALRRSEAKNRALLDAIPDMMFQVHRDGTYLDFKPAKDLTPVAPPEMFLGKKLQEILPAEVARQALEQIRRALETNIRQVFEYSLPTDGAFRDYEARVIASGEDQVLTIVREITERKRAEEALRNAKEFSENLIQTANVMILGLDTDGNIDIFNEAAEKITGYTLSEVRGRNWFEILVPKERYPPVWEEFTRLVAGGMPRVFENPILTKTGEERYIMWQNSQMRIHGEVVATISFGNDITERKQAEEALRESQRTFATLVSNLPGMVYRCRNDRNWTLEFTSDGCFSLTGYSPDDLLGNKIVSYGSMIHPDDQESVWESVQKALRENRPFQIIYRITTALGLEKWVWEHGRGVYSPGGDLFALEGFITDITERKRAEDELASEKERLTVTLGSIGDGVITTDMEERVVLMNKVAESLTGWTQQEAAGRPLPEIFHMIDEKTGRPLENPAVQVLQTGTTVGRAPHALLVSRDGAERTIAHSGAPIRDRAGGILGVVLVFRDITQHQKMEEDLLRTSKLEAVGLLAGGIAHDFNNILTAIMGNLSLAKMSTDPEDPLYRRLADAETASLRARDLAQQLLTFARGGAPIKKTVSMKRLIEESIRFALRGSNVAVEFFLPDDLWPVEIDEGQIAQVFHNLVINAQQAMPEGGKIQVRAENVRVAETENRLPLPPGKYLAVSIRDSGIGIAKEHLPRIFDPYFTTKQKGSGLGLSTSYSIIKKHDGYLTVDSELGKGATFFIYLPAASGEIEPERPPETLLQGEGKILIMDDEQAVREVAGEILCFLGYQIGYAENGAEAIARYQEASAAGAPFDLVIMDLTIPGKMGGKEAIQKLLEIDPHVKAIVSSGYSNDPIMADYARYGFKGVIAKPYQIEQLSRTVHEVLA
jgi:PAS domain S-box-containing protein